MARKYEILPATLEHIAALVPNVRPEDTAELWDGGHTTPEQVMLHGIRASEYAWAGVLNGEVICVFGVTRPSMLEPTGMPWMVGSTKLDSCAWGFLPRSRKIVHHMLNTYEHLENWVDARNTRAIKWLKWLGFQIHPPAPYGPYGVMFHKFEMRRGHV